jgi:hypothetical protein
MSLSKYAKNSCSLFQNPSKQTDELTCADVCDLHYFQNIEAKEIVSHSEIQDGCRN